MKKNLPVVTVVVLFVVGLCILLYPVVGNILNKMTSSAAISTYRTEISGLDEREIAQKLEAARSYNRIISSNDGATFAQGADFTTLREYIDYFSVNDVLGFISIPKISVYLPIYTGAQEEALEKGIWMMENTSVPVGGESTHSGLSGHRGLLSAKLFTDLDQLELGDEFYIYVLGEILAYKVDDISVVLPEDAEHLDIIKGEDHITLVTCTPYGINTHRLLVRGVRTEYSAKPDVSHSSLLEDNVKLIPWLVLGAVVIIILIPTALSIRSRRRRIERERQKLRRQYLLGNDENNDINQ